MRVNGLLWKNSMEKTEYIFIGAGGHARVMASVIESNQDTLLAVFDNDLNIKEMDGIKMKENIRSLSIQRLSSLSLLVTTKFESESVKTFILNRRPFMPRQLSIASLVGRRCSNCSGAVVNRGLTMESIQLSIPTQLIMTVSR